MTLAELINGGVSEIATAVPATPAIQSGEDGRPIARIATIAVAAREAQPVAQPSDDPPRAWITKEIRDGAGKLQAVKIGSEPLRDHLYVVFDPDFIPPEPLVVYSTEEIEAMKDKKPEQVLEIHKVKIVFLGARVIQ